MDAIDSYAKQRWPKWENKLCTSCSGSGHSWNGDGLGTCWSCKGWCSVWIHKPTGVRAAYPGGPFV